MQLSPKFLMGFNRALMTGIHYYNSESSVSLILNTLYAPLVHFPVLPVQSMTVFLFAFTLFFPQFLKVKSHRWHLSLRHANCRIVCFHKLFVYLSSNIPHSIACLYLIVYCRLNCHKHLSAGLVWCVFAVCLLLVHRGFTWNMKQLYWFHSHNNTDNSGFELGVYFVFWSHLQWDKNCSEFTMVID